MMSMTRIRVERMFERFARDVRALSAVEFALILPLMVTLFLGGTELSQAIAVKRKTVLVNRTVADLVAQDPSITNAEMNAIFAASAAVVAPYSANNLKIVVSQVRIDSNGAATVYQWSKAYQSTERPVNSAVALPAGMNVPNTYLVMAETSYTYTPPIGYTITGQLQLNDVMYLRPRLTTTIACCT
jgi:Flp pilus assembly protein TadG